VVFLTGSNFLNGLNGNLGDSFGDLKVDFKVGGKSYSGTVVPDLSSSLADNRYKVAVKAPISVPLGESEIVLSRQQKERFGPGPLDSDVAKRSSVEDLQLKPVFSDLVLVAKRSADKIRVIDALSSGTTPPSPQQKPPKDVSVGIPGTRQGVSWDRPGQLAVTSNATRAYVPLEWTGRVAMVDLLARREVDVDASTPTVDDINLGTDASPGAITIDPWDNYGYIADSKQGRIYILDVNPDSAKYNQVVETILVDATSGLRQIAINSDGRKLFATALNGSIYAINIDPDDKPSQPNSNPRKWRELIGKVGTRRGAFGLSATPDPDKMVFTSGNTGTDESGFGVLTVNDDPLNWDPKTTYADLTLGSNSDIFDVNEGVAVTVTADGKYAFVAGSSQSRSNQVGADPREGGNIGIIEDPLGLTPKLVAATQQVPDSFTNNVALSSDGKYLIGSYPTLNNGGYTYAFNVPEIIKTVKKTGVDWTQVPIDVANPLIFSPIDNTGGSPRGLVLATKLPTFKQQIEKLLKGGSQNYSKIGALIFRTNDQNDLRTVSSDPGMRKLIADNLTSEQAIAIMAALLKGEQRWRNTPNDFIPRFFNNDKDPEKTLPYNATLNCWEMILYAAFLCGQISGERIKKFLDNTYPLQQQMKTMGYSRELPFYPGRGSNDPTKTKFPQPGDLVYFQENTPFPGHVAISLFGSLVVSLWDQPDLKDGKNNRIQIVGINEIGGSVRIGPPLTEAIKSGKI
jgi:hypothetical protein